MSKRSRCPCRSKLSLFRFQKWIFNEPFDPFRARYPVLYRRLRVSQAIMNSLFYNLFYEYCNTFMKKKIPSRFSSGIFFCIRRCVLSTITRSAGDKSDGGRSLTSRAVFRTDDQKQGLSKILAGQMINAIPPIGCSDICCWSVAWRKVLSDEAF